jgi:hypothetical protein
MKKIAISPTTKKLAKIWFEHADELPAIYKWENEKERENELYCCILSNFNNGNAIDVRAVMSHMLALNLIDTEKLARAKFEAKGETKDRTASAIISILLQTGMNEKYARRATRAICEAAKIIQDSYDGKIQKFLRKHAEEMIKELHSTFRFTDKEIDKNTVFTMWLQNALEMPIILPCSHIRKFIKKNKITHDELITSADDLYINPMVIDDLLRIYSDSR